MRALSIRQPWAYAILTGAKPVENRNWPTNVRGRVLIHASKKEERGDVYPVLWRVARQLGRSLDDIEIDYHARKNLGCIVGVATIADCVTEHPSEWFVGTHGFVMRDPVFLPEPIPCKGALGFFYVLPDVAETVRAAADTPAA